MLPAAKLLVMPLPVPREWEETLFASTPIVTRKNPRARSIIIRVTARPRQIEVVIPRYGTKQEALRFLERRKPWVIAQLAELPEEVPFIAGNLVPILGKEYRICHIEQPRGRVWREGEWLYVSGYTEHIRRRVTDYLKKQALAEIAPLAYHYAEQLGKKVHSISLRDTTSRWGSCSASGNLSFSWRLVMAPPEIIDYLVAHEVAHLCHLDHSPAFWEKVSTLCPNHQQQRHWLREHGKRLLAYG